MDPRAHDARGLASAVPGRSCCNREPFGPRTGVAGDRRRIGLWFMMGVCLASLTLAQEEVASRPVVPEPPGPGTRLPDKEQLAAAVAQAYR